MGSNEIEFIKMQVEHANMVSDIMLGIASLTATLAIFVVTYQLFINKRTIDTLKKENKDFVTEMTRYIFLSGVRSLAQLPSNRREIEEAITHYKNYFHNDKEVFDELNNCLIQILNNRLSVYSSKKTIKATDSISQINLVFGEAYGDIEKNIVMSTFFMLSQERLWK